PSSAAPIPRSAMMLGARIDRICRSSRLRPCDDETRNSVYHPARVTLAVDFSGSSATVAAILVLSLLDPPSPAQRDGEVAEAARPLTEGLSRPLLHPAGGPLPEQARGGSLSFQRLGDRLRDRRGPAAGEAAQVSAVVVKRALARQRAGAGQHRRDRRRQPGAFE